MRADEETIVKTFVGRNNVLEHILERLRVSLTSKSTNHILLTGPRGIGKTHMLLMVKDRVLREMEAHFLVAMFDEEERGICSLADFYAHVLERLGQHPVPEMRRKGENALLDALRDIHTCHKKKILVLVDNINLILTNYLADEMEQGRFRNLLMNEDFIVLVATAAEDYKEFKEYPRPFFSFFENISLEDFSDKDFEDFINCWATIDGDHELKEKLKSGMVNVRAITTLSGATPRIAMFLYEIITHTRLENVIAEFENLLERFTTFYRDGVLLSLPPQEQIILDGFMKKGGASTPSDVWKLLVEEGKDIKLNNVTAAVSRLRDKRLLRIREFSRQPRRKETVYEIRDKLFVLWYEMRYSFLHREKNRYVIEFLTAWYAHAPKMLLGEVELALFNKGVRLSRMERYEDALEAYDKALDLNKQNITITLKKADILLEMNRPEEAIGALAAGLRVADDIADVAEALSEGLRGWLEAKRFKFAHDVCMLAAKIHGDELAKRIKPAAVAAKALATGDYSEIKKLDVATFETVKRILEVVGR
ncbi:MAG: AAA family ATPase [Candidatus Thermoplasmatota archaeon]